MVTTVHTQRKTFRSAVEALRQGNRAGGYLLLRQVLMDDPNCAPAWLWMSGLVVDTRQQRECLEQTLILDPGCDLAREGLKLLQLRETLAGIPAALPATSEHAPRRLGEYLVAQGFVSEAQVEEALAEQQRRRLEWNERVLLGDILVQRGWLMPQTLAKTLLLQQRDQRGAVVAPLPQRLGEYLVVDGVITTGQLAAVLEEQAHLHKTGTSMMLGEILLRGGYVTPEVLNRALEQQRQDLYNGLSYQEPQP